MVAISWETAFYVKINPGFFYWINTVQVLVGTIFSLQKFMLSHYAFCKIFDMT